MNKEQENFISILCLNLKKVLNKDKSYIAVQMVFYAYIVLKTFTELISSIYILPFMVLVILIISGVLTVIKQNIKMCGIGIALDILAIILGISFKVVDYDTAIMLSVIILIYGFRIKLYLFKEKISCLYGFPSFNSFYIINELSHDEKNINDVLGDYEDIMNDKLVKHELKIIKSNNILKTVRAVSVLLVAAGIVFSFNVKSYSGKNSMDFNTVKAYELQNGKAISGSIDTLYCLSGVGGDRFTSDSYWCRFGDTSITVEVPPSYRMDFARLYNYFAEQGAFPKYIGCIEPDGVSSDAIKFEGIVRSVDKYGASEINKTALKNARPNDENFVSDYYIEIIDSEASSNLILSSLILVFAGVSAYAFTEFSFFHKDNNMW